MLITVDSAAKHLPALKKLKLHNCTLDVLYLRNFLRAFSRLPQSISITHCEGFDWDDMIDVLVEEASLLDSLHLSRISRMRPSRPRRFDFLRHFPKLRKFQLNGQCLAWDSLSHMGPDVSMVVLGSNTLSLTEIALNVATWDLKEGSKITLMIKGIFYDQRERDALEVCVLMLSR